jgi:hypothetical protein
MLCLLGESAIVRLRGHNSLRITPRNAPIAYVCARWHGT